MKLDLETLYVVNLCINDHVFRGSLFINRRFMCGHQVKYDAKSIHESTKSTIVNILIYYYYYFVAGPAILQRLRLPRRRDPVCVP